MIYVCGINALGQEEYRRKNAGAFGLIITLNIMYKIIGADQKEYGPISAEQMRQWIAEGRINAQTQAQAAGETTWKSVSMFPEFAASFSAAPPPLPSMGAAIPGGDSRTRALQDVSGPAIGLMVTAALGALASLVGIAMSVLGVSMNSMQNFGSNGQNAEMFRVMQMFAGTLGIVFRIIGILVCVFIFFGALKMKKLENYGLCMGASIVAMIPCISPCCLIGLPIGIWALVVLNKPEIKSSFS